jgi:hypothetical protein
LRPGGILLYETFTKEQKNRGHDPDFPEAAAGHRVMSPLHLLEPGELPGLVAPLEVVRQHEGECDGQHLASVAARKRA